MNNQVKKWIGIILFLVIAIGLVAMLNNKPEQKLETPAPDRTSVLINLVQPYRTAYDGAHDSELRGIADELNIIAQLRTNVKQIADARTVKCFNAAVSEKLTQYFMDSDQAPTPEVIKAAEDAAHAGCDKNVKFTEARGEIMRKFDGKVTPENDNVNAEEFPLVSSPSAK